MKLLMSGSFTISGYDPKSLNNAHNAPPMIKSYSRRRTRKGGLSCHLQKKKTKSQPSGILVSSRTDPQEGRSRRTADPICAHPWQAKPAGTASWKARRNAASLHMREPQLREGEGCQKPQPHVPPPSPGRRYQTGGKDGQFRYCCYSQSWAPQDSSPPGHSRRERNGANRGSGGWCVQ